MPIERLRHLGVAARIAWGFGFVMLILVMQSALGFMSATDSLRVMQLEVSQARSLRDLAIDLRELVQREDLHMRQMAVLIDAERIREETAQVRSAGAEIDRTIAALLRAPLPAAQRTLVEDIGRLSRDTRSARDEVMALSAAMQTDQANERYDQVLAKASAMRRELAGKFAQAQRAALDQALLRVEELAKRSQSATIVSAAIALLAASAAGWVLFRAITKPLREAAAIADQVAGGDLAVSVRTDARNEFGHMLRALDSMAAQMRQTITAIHESSENVLQASREISAGNGDLSSRTEHQASMLQMTAASMVGISEAVSGNARAAREADQLAAQAAEMATGGGRQMQRLVETMHSIAASSQRMSDIVGVMDGIAFQTNILALNASVEAARAGEQGRGFSVVANEVRSLAQRAAEAAREIKVLIEVNVGAVGDGTTMAADTGAMIGQVVDSSQRVTAVVAEIARASSEQAVTVEQIKAAVSQIDQGLQQNSALVEQSAAAAESLQSQAQSLNQSVRRFRLV